MLSDKSINEEIIKFKSPIQNILVDQYRNDFWVVELSKNRTFIRIRLKDLQISEHKILIEESYNLVEVNNGLIAFKKSHDPSKIEMAGFKIYSVLENEFIRDYEGYRFLNFNGMDSINFSKQHFDKVEYLTDSLELPESAKINQNQSKVMSPEPIHKGQDFYNSISEFFEPKLEGKIFGPIDFLEALEHLFFSFHIKQNNTMVKYLLVLDNKKEIIKITKCNENLKKLIPESFFLYSNFLIFVSTFDTLHIIDFNE